MIKLIKEADEKVKNNLKDFSEQEIRSFIDSIDFDRMAEILSDKLGIKNLVINVDPEFDANYYQKSRDLYIHYESDNLIDQCGIFSAVFSDVVINDFGAKVIVDNSKLYYLASAHLSWEYIVGGSNGARLPFRMYWDGIQWIVK